MAKRFITEQDAKAIKVTVGMCGNNVVVKFDNNTVIEIDPDDGQVMVWLWDINEQLGVKSAKVTEM